MRPIVKLLFALFLVLIGPARAVAAEPDPYARRSPGADQAVPGDRSQHQCPGCRPDAAQMHPQATVTWLNGEVSRGHAEIKAYYQRMVKGEQRILDRYLTTAKLGASAHFFGNGEVAVADGTMEDEFFPVARGLSA
jgi:hypothetical protein